MKQFSVVLMMITLAACQPAEQAPKEGFPAGRWVDLSHPFDENTIYWPTAESFRLDTVAEGVTDKGYYYSAYSFCAAEHGGTHMDAPVHFARGKNAVEQIPLEQLIGPAIVVDVSDKALENRDYLIQVSDFEAWEQAHGRIPQGAIVLVNTGSAQFWPDRQKYMGTEERGVEAVPKLHFPGLHPDAARWLAEERAIKAFGLDTPSIDYGQSTNFESHQILGAANIPGLENIANLGQLPPKGSWAIGLPMLIRHGSGAPLRIIALAPEG